MEDFYQRLHKEYFPLDADQKYRTSYRHFKQFRNESVAMANIRFNEIVYNIEVKLN
jgi:hypothetical protein